MIPNTLGISVVTATFSIADSIYALSALSFLGIGPPPPFTDWGTMLSDGRQFITVAAHVAAIPGLAIFVLVLGCNLLGDGLRDALDPRLR